MTYKLYLSITDFIQHGRFDFLKIGMSKSELIEQFFPPENWLNDKTAEESSIWRYGNFELYFNEQQRLIRIFNDWIPNLDGGDSIEIQDTWIFHKHSSLTLQQVMVELNNLKVVFTKTATAAGSIQLKLQHGAFLSFDCPDDQLEASQNDFALFALGCE